VKKPTKEIFNFQGGTHNPRRTKEEHLLQEEHRRIYAASETSVLTFSGIIGKASFGAQY
jgi:hypothetical protein